MGRDWDSFVPGPNIWNEIMRCTQPEGHILSFSGTRTYDLMVAAMDIAAEKHDCKLSGYHAWCYGSGFPKSMNIGKSIEAKIKTGSSSPRGQRMAAMGTDYEPSPMAGTPGYGTEGNRGTACQPNTNSKPMELTEDEAIKWAGYGTALKPAHEPVAEYVKGGGAKLQPESLFHYVPKPGTKERDLGCKNLYWKQEGLDTQPITKDEYEKFKDMDEHRVLRGNVWPTVKPIELMRRLIRMAKRPGQKNVILEPFMGSGTTIIAALLEGCDYVGIDADPVAFKIASARVRYFKCLGEFALK